MIIITLRIKVALEKRKDVIDLYESYRGPVSVLPNCASIHLYSNYTNRNGFVLLEEWNSEKAFKKHIRSNDFFKI